MYVRLKQDYSPPLTSQVYHGVLDKFGEISVRVRIPLARDGGAVTPYQVMLSEVRIFRLPLSPDA